MTIRCKMALDNVIPYNTTGTVKAIFSCRYDAELCKEDLAFQKSTPWGQLEFVVDNPVAIKQLIIGKTYYLDFNPVD